MLAALRGPNATEGGVSAARGRRKVIYLAPSRALVSEKAREWRERLGRIGITFAELTGDSDFGGDVWGEIENVDAILATPEKFDRVTRLDANRGGMSFFSDVAAVLIDEVHLIGDVRGGCLEAIVSRLKLLSKSSALLQSHLRNVRFGAVSATIPNIENLANWLGADRDGTFVFGEEFRPVKLQTYVRSFPDATSDFLFNKYLKQKVFAVIREFLSRQADARVFGQSQRRAADGEAARGGLSQTVRKPTTLSIPARSVHASAEQTPCRVYHRRRSVSSRRAGTRRSRVGRGIVLLSRYYGFVQYEHFSCGR